MSHDTNSNERLADLSRMAFSTRLWREVARSGSSKELDDALRRAEIELGLNPHSRAESLRSIHGWMLRSRRPDYTYRQALISRFARRSHHGTVRFLTELHLRSSIADLVRIGGDLETFEIKSDRDNTSRLPNQLWNAYLVSPYASLVTTPANASQFLARTPSTPVGVYTIGPRGGLRLLHQPTARWQRLESTEILNLLRADERAYALRDIAPTLPQEPNTLRYRIAVEAAAEVKPKEFYLRAVEALRKRAPMRLEPALYYIHPILVSVNPNSAQLARIHVWLKKEAG